MHTTLPAPRTLPFIPGVSVIPLEQRSGVYTLQVTRHWPTPPADRDAAPAQVWYELVMRIPGTTTVTVLPLERLHAAQLLSAEVRLRRAAEVQACEDAEDVYATPAEIRQAAYRARRGDR